MLTHHNLVANFVQSSAGMCVEESDVLLGVLPFFHIYGMTVIMNFALYLGATVVTHAAVRPGAVSVDDSEIWRHRSQRRAADRAGAGQASAGRQLSAGELRFLLSGAAPLTEHLAAAAAARLGCRVLQGYGLTETSPVTHASPHAWTADQRGQHRPSGAEHRGEGR